MRLIKSVSSETEPKPLSFNEQLKEDILDYGAIIYAPVSKEDGFYVIKVPGEPIAYLHEDFISKKEKGEYFTNYDMPYPNGVPRYNCLIFDGSKSLYNRVSDENVVQYFLDKYGNAIAKAPEFSISAFFEPVYKMAPIQRPGTAFDGMIGSEFDYLRLKDKVKIASPEYFKYINDLLRRVGLLKEKRGKVKRLDETTIAITNFIKKRIKENRGKKEKLIPSKLKMEYDKQLRKDFIPLDNEDEMTEKEAEKAEEEIKRYQRDVETIRRILKNLMKK